MVLTSIKNSTGIGMLVCGGTGLKVSKHIGEMKWKDDLPVAFEELAIDTDHNEKTPVNNTLRIGLTPENAGELMANAERFDPHLPDAVKHLGHMFDTGNLQVGSKTTPAITQCAFVYHLTKIEKALIRLISNLKKDPRVKQIQLILVGSTGGGCGSALLRLIPWWLGKPEFRNRLLMGLDPYLLKPPIVFTAYPYAYARHASIQRQEMKILSNLYAWQRETDALSYQGLISQVMAVGYSNNSGTVLDTSDRMVEVLATSLHHFLHNYTWLMSRLTDVLPHPRLDRYTGMDRPELKYPSVMNEVRKYYPEEK